MQKVVDYTFGTDEISQTVETYEADGTATRQTHHFLHDGHGSVRVLTNAAEAVARLTGTGTAALHQVYVFDAYGNALNQAARHAATVLLYSGEQWDAPLGQQYLRARYYDAGTGHFNRLDPFFGNRRDPQSLHKYGYVHSDPTTLYDPTGLSGIGRVLAFGRGLISIFNTVLRNPITKRLVKIAAGGVIGAGVFSKLGQSKKKGAALGLELAVALQVAEATKRTRAVLEEGVTAGVIGALFEALYLTLVNREVSVQSIAPRFLEDFVTQVSSETYAYHLRNEDATLGQELFYQGATATAATFMRELGPALFDDKPVDLRAIAARAYKSGLRASSNAFLSHAFNGRIALEQFKNEEVEEAMHKVGAVLLEFIKEIGVRAVTELFE